MPAPPYRFNYGEPGLFVEIYLPKKAVYQGPLYDTLTHGFDLDAVRAHFRAEKKAILSFLSDYEELDADAYDARVKSLSPAYEGYSLYELDGVFRARRKQPRHRKSPKRRNYELAEERVQVVRIMFLPPLNRLAPAALDRPMFPARRYLRHWTHELSTYRESLCAAELTTPGLEEYLQMIKGWLDDVGLFVNGYVLFRICRAMQELHKRGFVGQLEEEIWASSFRCLAVNKITLLKKRRRRTRG